MSIINDALKKAEGDKSGLDRKDPLYRAQYATKRPGINWGPVFIVSVILLIAGPIIAPLFSSPFKKNRSLSLEQGSMPLSALREDRLPAPMAGPAVTRKAQFGIEEAPRMALFGGRVPQMAISGVVVSPQGSYCIINDTVVREGERIQGAQIVSVNANTVTVEYQGERLGLPG